MPLFLKPAIQPQEHSRFSDMVAASNSDEFQYLALLERLLEAPLREDRTCVGTHSIFGHQMRFDLAKGFPLLTTKKVHFHSVVVELLWFLRGDTNIKYLLEHNVHIWTDWRYKAYREFMISKGTPESELLSTKSFEEMLVKNPTYSQLWGNIGKGYGRQWRNFGQTADSPGVDQISAVIEQIKKDPYSRRHIVTAWNPLEVDQVDLPPCHTLFQFYVQGDKLSCQLYQRSADAFLGLPFNIASYALLTHLVARECGLQVGEFVWTGGDIHLYSNHVDQARKQITRTPYEFPLLYLSKGSIFSMEPEDIQVLNYNHHSAIQAEVAV